LHQKILQISGNLLQKVEHKSPAFSIVQDAFQQSTKRKKMKEKSEKKMLGLKSGTTCHSTQQN